MRVYRRKNALEHFLRIGSISICRARLPQFARDIGLAPRELHRTLAALQSAGRLAAGGDHLHLAPEARS